MSKSCSIRYIWLALFGQLLVGCWSSAGDEQGDPGDTNQQDGTLGGCLAAEDVAGVVELKMVFYNIDDDWHFGVYDWLTDTSQEVNIFRTEDAWQQLLSGASVNDPVGVIDFNTHDLVLIIKHFGTDSEGNTPSWTFDEAYDSPSTERVINGTHTAANGPGIDLGFTFMRLLKLEKGTWGDNVTLCWNRI